MDTFSILNKIHELFKEKKFIAKIGSKNNVNDISQHITYINPYNNTEKYIINILNLNNIIVTVPLKNTNFNYKTNLNINRLYNFLYIHSKNI